MRSSTRRLLIGNRAIREARKAVKTSVKGRANRALLAKKIRSARKGMGGSSSWLRHKIQKIGSESINRKMRGP